MSTIQDGTQEANKLLRNEEPQLFQPDVYRDPQLEFVKGRQPSAGFIDKVDAAISQLSPTINLADRNDLAVARETSTQVDVPDEALVFGLPKEFQIAVLDEKAKHGSTAALTLSDQIKQDIDNNTVMDNLDWYAQLGYSAIGFLADPTTFIAGAGAVKVGANLSTVASKAAPSIGASMPRTAGVLTEWGAVGAIESATLNAPRLGGDHTYKLENYYTDIVVDALLGAGLTYGISKAVNKAGQLQEQVRNRESATAERMQMMERELETAGQTTEPSDFDADEVLSGKRKTLQEVEAGTKQTGGMRHDPRVKIDNDTQWLATQADSLRKQVEEVNKFRRFIDTSELMNHPAYQKPTATNIADLNAKLQAKLSQARAITDSQQPKPVSVGKEKKLSALMHTKSATSTKFLSIMFNNLNTAAMKKADNWKSSPIANVAEPALTRLETLEAAVREAGASPFKKQFEFRLKELMNSMSAKASEQEAVKYARDIDAFVDEWSSVSSPRIDSNGGSSLGSQMSTTIGKIDDEAARLLESGNELLDKRNREQPSISAEQQWQTKGKYATEVKLSEVSFEAKAAQAKVEALATKAEMVTTTKQAREDKFKADLQKALQSDEKPDLARVAEILNRPIKAIRAVPETPSSKAVADKIDAANARIQSNPLSSSTTRSNLQDGLIEDKALVAAVEEGKLTQPEEVPAPQVISTREIVVQEIPLEVLQSMRTGEEVRKWLLMHAPDNTVRQLMRELEGSLDNVNFTATDQQSVGVRRAGQSASFEDGTTLVSIYKEGLNSSTVTHELLHAATARRIGATGEHLTRAQRDTYYKIRKDILEATENVRLTKAERHAVQAGTSNVHELMTWSLTSPAFQRALMKLSKEQVGAKPSLLNRLSSLLRSILGLGMHDSALGRVIDFTSEVLVSTRHANFKGDNGLQSKVDLAQELVSDVNVQVSASAKLLRDSHIKLNDEVSAYHASGEHKVYRDLLTPSNLKQMAARAVSQWGGVTQDLATRFIESKSPTINWVGTHLTEMGRGYGGDVMRKHTAGVIREAEYIKSISMIMPDYDKAVKEYAASLGSNKVGEMMAAVSVGGQNKVQEAFARKFMKYMNDTRRGRTVDDQEMAAFAAKWNEYMRHNYKQLEQNNIAGFTGDNQRNNYVPQVWQVKHAQRLLRDPLQAQDMKTLLTKATGDAEKADQLIEWFGQQDAATYDGYVATNDARAISRMEVDWSVEHNGMSVLDLLETDTRKLATSYSNRVAGWVGVSKSTNGALRSYTDINALKLMAYQESDSIKDVELLEDVIDMLFGRQVQGGLPDYARSIKAATVLTRLGGLGSAQLIESGTAATRAIMESAGDPKFMKKLVKGMSPKETAQDLLEIQKMTGNDWDYHLINTEAEYYTEYDLADTGKLQNSVDKAVDVATGGHFKQLAGRAFGHVTGYNQVRRFQSAMVQRSFAMQVARMFKHGDSKMSVQRAADYGLVDAQGRNESLQAAIEKHVEFDSDGYPTKYNFDKWEPEAKDTFMYSLQRAEATELMRPLVGEMPSWFNKPWMQMLMQFRTMPLVAQNKALGRSLAFADKEAVVQLTLNAMTAGIVRYGKYAGLAALAAGTGAKFEDEFEQQVNRAGRDTILGGAVDRYITQGGMYSDMYALTLIGSSASTPQEYLERATGQIPAMGLIKDYAMGAYAISEQDGDKALRHITGVTPLGNTLAFEAAEAVVTEVIGDN